MLSGDEKDSRGEAKRAQTEEEESDGDKIYTVFNCGTQPTPQRKHFLLL